MRVCAACTFLASVPFVSWYSMKASKAVLSPGYSCLGMGAHSSSTRVTRAMCWPHGADERSGEREVVGERRVGSTCRGMSASSLHPRVRR
jgi:hypothetical protein